MLEEACASSSFSPPALQFSVSGVGVLGEFSGSRVSANFGVLLLGRPPGGRWAASSRSCLTRRFACVRSCFLKISLDVRNRLGVLVQGRRRSVTLRRIVGSAEHRKVSVCLVEHSVEARCASECTCLKWPPEWTCMLVRKCMHTRAFDRVRSNIARNRSGGYMLGRARFQGRSNNRSVLGQIVGRKSLE